MLLVNVLTSLSLAISALLLYVTAKGDLTPNELQQNATIGGSASLSPWLKKVMNHPRAPGCWRRPWICYQGERPRRRRCCRNRCVDVSSDVNNCGLCGIKCPFMWQCCRGLCIDTNISPFNCGRCGHRCRSRSLCYYGMCGYAQPLPPWPFPPKPPKPPHPPKPPKPPHHPPRGDQPPPSI